MIIYANYMHKFKYLVIGVEDGLMKNMYMRNTKFTISMKIIWDCKAGIISPIHNNILRICLRGIYKLNYLFSGSIHVNLLGISYILLYLYLLPSFNIYPATPTYTISTTMAKKKLTISLAVLKDTTLIWYNAKNNV